MAGTTNDNNDRNWKRLQVMITLWNASASTARLLWELIKNYGQ